MYVSFGGSVTTLPLLRGLNQSLGYTVCLYHFQNDAGLQHWEQDFDLVFNIPDSDFSSSRVSEILTLVAV